MKYISMKAVRLKWTNSEDRYGAVSMLIHWSTVALFVTLYSKVYYRHWFTAKGSSESLTAIQLHFSFGILVAVLLLFRIAYRLRAISPEHLNGGRLTRALSTTVHFCLYAVMIVMPLTGYLGTKVDTDFFGIIIIPKFADTPAFETLIAKGMGLSFAEFEKPLDAIHHFLGSWIVWLLIVGHASAALFHHWVLKDDVLLRMLPRRGT